MIYTLLILWTLANSIAKHEKWYTININPDQFCSGGTIFVVITGPARPFMLNINSAARPFMHPDQIFRYSTYPDVFIFFLFDSF